jgi:prepilin peptidase CpaA
MILDIARTLTLLAAPALVFAALHDVAFRTIPNWVSAALIADGILLRLFDHTLVVSLCCGLAVFVCSAVCWRRGWLGGGDVKLLGATAVLVPPSLVPGYVASVAFAGGGLALIYLLLERLVPALPALSRRPSENRLRHPASLPWRILIVECRRIRRRASLPYATAISVAALLMLVKG